MEGFKVKFQKLQGREWECNRQDYAFVGERERERERESERGIWEAQEPQKREREGGCIAGATNNQHANENSITHPTNNFLSFWSTKFLIILPSP
jgi:hypothetical protein